MNTSLALAADLLYREADCLDSQKWDEWLALYTDDCEFWMPAWKAEHELTNDPRRELSLVYYKVRAGLEDRVSRVRSGESIASIPMPRTHHAITNVVLASETPDALELRSNWLVHQFRTKFGEVEVFFGRYEHRLVRHDASWLIARKKIVLLNDQMSTMLDFYNM